MTASPALTLPRPAPGPTPKARKERDPFLDNAKFLLVVLVVVGHNWGALPVELPAVRAAYSVVYLFHMPAFVLLCGLFSRGFTGRPDQIRALFAKVLAPYLLFTVAYKACYAWAWGTPFSLTPTKPTYLLWFLMALFLWRITTPVWRAVRHPVPLAVALSIGTGLTGMSYELALPRVLMFLPWFVLGLQLSPEHFRRLRAPAVRAAAALVLGAALALAYALAPWTNIGWLHMQYNAGELHTGRLTYIGARLALFAAAALLVAAFLALVPRRRTWFTALGALTMFPFLTHGLLVQTGQALGLYEALGADVRVAAPVTTLLGLAMAALALAAPVRRALRPFVEPRFPRRLVPARDQA